MDYKKVNLTNLLNEIKNILKEKDVRLDDNFIELGGNSVMALLILRNMELNYGVSVNLAQLLGEEIGKVTIIPLEK
ncbi:phosphopantetheine-binding protein [Pantoea sp. FN0307]|uniref:phosphopantetheine-binding protein n=1 Tax=Pantoea sp. FN0307 TaxID=3418560 RepID=UPI003CF96379